MLRKLSIIFLYSQIALGQTAVYVRAGAPQSQAVIGATNATPIVITTSGPHGFSSSCNTTSNICYCGPTGVPTGTGPSPVNGVRECVYVDTTHLSLFDTSGNPVAGTGNWWPGYTNYPNLNPSAQWNGALTKYTIPASPGPLGYFDGTNGDLMRRVSLGPLNGLTSLVVAGCPSACVATITASYNLLTGKFPIAAGQHFSITGTGTALDTCGDGTSASGAQSPYTVGSSTTSTIVSNSFACSISNADYANINLHCGPAGSPNDTIGGTQSCTRVSQMAYTGNPAWDNLVTRMTNLGFNSGNTYKSYYDGGTQSPQNGINANYGMAAVRFVIDQTNQHWLDIMVYSLDNDQRTNGVGYAYNSLAFAQYNNSLYNYTNDMRGLALSLAVAAPYRPAASITAFLNRTYNDSDDPSVTACTTTNQDAANQSTHNWVLSTGLVAAGTNDATHFQLPNTDAHFGTVDYYKNTVVMLGNGGSGIDYIHSTYGLITGVTSGGVATVSGWVNGAGGGGVTPARDNVVSGTYVSGLTCTGSSGQTIGIINSAGNMQATVALPLSNGSPLNILVPGSGYSSAPTTGALSNFFGQVSYTCTGTPTISTSLGTPYTIFDTVTINTTATGTAATVTFTKTASLSGTINTGDGIIGQNGWPPSFYVGYSLSYISSVGSNTLSVINGPAITASPATPRMAWRIPQWVSGDCGRLRASKAQQSNSYAAQSAIYGPSIAATANLTTNFINDAGANGGGANPPDWMIFDLAAAGATGDSRAVRDLARSQGYLFDYAVRPMIDFSTGRLRDGPVYSLDQDGPTGEFFVWSLTNSIPAYPKLDITGPWAQNQSIWHMFQTLPDNQGGNPNVKGWAGQSGDQGGALTRVGAVSYGLAFSPATYFLPASAATARYRNWQERVGPSSLWGYTLDDSIGLSFLHNDPRVGSSDFTILPKQFAFNTSSDVTANTGWPVQYRGDAVISRTGWSVNGSRPNDTVVLFDAATPSGNNSEVYDTWRAGQLSIWNTGSLLGSDSNPANSTWAVDPSAVSDTFGFNAAGSSQYNGGDPPIGRTLLTRWASATAGSFGAQFGDDTSRYAAWCEDIGPNYNQTALGISLDHAQICGADMKKPGNDQFIFEFHDVALTSGTATMAWHLHYPQNGTAQTGGAVNMGAGTTTALGGNVIKTVEDGGGSPARTHGLLTYITSPLPFALNDDCIGHAGGQCGPGDTYPGGNGFTHRFTVAGGASVGTAVGSFVSVVVHKVMSNLTDTTFTHTDLNPDANWTGVQACGAVSCAVFLGGRKGQVFSMVTTFNTNHNGLAQYLVTGLAPGTYNVTVGGSPVLTGTRVFAGDNHIYFEYTATNTTPRAVSIVQQPPTPPGSALRGITLRGNTSIH